MAIRHRYSHDELEEYFNRISLPYTRRVHSVAHLSDAEKLDFLHLLQKHQLCKVPWENLIQHYSFHHVVHIAPSHLFRKIVRNPGRGGYCMEVNYFYHLILYSLGFDVYVCGARIYSPSTDTYGGWTHCVNLVTIGGQKYLLDGGFGGNGPSCPVPLEENVVLEQVAPAEMRLIHEPIRENLNQSQKLWIFQHRYSSSSDWVTCYSFPDLEFTPADLTAMNLAPSSSRHSFFTHKVVAVRFSTSAEINGPQGPGSPNEAALASPVDGAITLNHDVLKWRRRGQKVVEWTLKSEEERVQALEMYFGIEVGEEDVRAIEGTAAEVGARAMLHG
ncbi:hypothetical protein DOTSEDRAFT_79667 [Dothistroma septosporum NZE10]|uniref:Uncharacterized protein n=1 Tax=Dothistroma septosporum (strain NZE10 / CBS 128990) TaxID=675120 RepID=N1PTR7_DOTSN|nr:hypothetical protein DOTSEDRAFT_79667 [Dothistroma septosporum NZE10]